MKKDSPSDRSGLHLKLSIMMFLQYAIWGAWLPLFYGWLTGSRNLSPEQAGTLFAVAAIGALVAPFLAGQIADRWFATEKFLALSHIVGAGLIWFLPGLETYNEILIFGLLYSIVYSPTLSLTNSIAFHHLEDRDRDFGRVRLWGTVGWIVVGIGMGQWLLRQYQNSGADVTTGYADSFHVSAALGAILGIYCFFLPHTPPAKGKDNFAAKEAFASIVKNRRLLALFLVSFPLSCIHQFYFVRTADFLASLKMKTEMIDKIFGVGGGPMTIGQISEIIVLACIPALIARWRKKTLLLIGIGAYVLRFWVFAHVDQSYIQGSMEAIGLNASAAVYAALTLHGLCFGCFFFVAFMIVDEETNSDVRATAQSYYSLVIFGLGVIVGNYMAGEIGGRAKDDVTGVVDFHYLFEIPMFIAIACGVALLLAYPKSRAKGAA